MEQQATGEGELVQLVDKPEKGEAAIAAGPRESLTLLDGRRVQLGRATGRHLIKAATVSGGENQFATLMGLVAQVATIDGKSVVYEDLLEMDAMDVVAMVGTLLGNVPSLGLGI